jgi:hypothetical protein
MNVRSLFGLRPSTVPKSVDGELGESESTGATSTQSRTEEPLPAEISAASWPSSASPVAFKLEEIHSGTQLPTNNDPSPRSKTQANSKGSNNSNNSSNMSSARDIAGGLTNAFQNGLSLSVSPTSTFHSPSTSFGARGVAANAASKQLKPFNTGDVRILLLENVNQTAQDILRKQGYQVEFHKSSLPEDELIEKIRYAISLFLFCSMTSHATFLSCFFFRRRGKTFSLRKFMVAPQKKNPCSCKASSSHPFIDKR